MGEDFEKPPGRTFRVVLNCEIVAAEDFETTFGSSLFIHYFLELPMGWSINESYENSNASGITQVSDNMNKHEMENSKEKMVK